MLKLKSGSSTKQMLLFLTTLITLLATTTNAMAPIAPETGIVKFHHMHDALPNEGACLMINQDKADSIILWSVVDPTGATWGTSQSGVQAVPKKATATFHFVDPHVSPLKRTSTDINSTTGLINIDLSKSFINSLKNHQANSGIAFVQIQLDALLFYTISNVRVGHKVIWTGQSETTMTEFTMLNTTTYPLYTSIASNPNCKNLYFYHAITVLSSSVVAAGSSPTPVDDLPIDPTHGWINCESPSFEALIKGPTNAPGFGALAGFSKTGLAIAIQLADKTDWQVPIMIYSVGAISTSLAPWSSQAMISKSGVTTFIDVPRTKVNTAMSLYNGQLHPLRFFGYTAVARMQGNSNALENRMDFDRLLPYWHHELRSVFQDSKLVIVEVQLCPFIGSSTPQYFLIRDAQAKIKSLPYSYLVTTWDLHDEIGAFGGALTTDRGLHNRHGVLIAKRIVDQLERRVLNRQVQTEGPQPNYQLFKYDSSSSSSNGVSSLLKITVKFAKPSHADDNAALQVYPTPDCADLSTCGMFINPIEVRYNSTWTPLSSIPNSANDVYTIQDYKIDLTFANVYQRPLINGIRITTNPRSTTFVGDGTYPIDPFEYVYPALSN